MSGILATSLSGLMAAQRSLEAVQHNIANVNTEGYSRQRVELATNIAQQTNEGYIGQGVNIINVTRSYDQFITKQLSVSLSSYNDVDHYHQLAANVDNILADPSTGIAPVMKRFFNAVNEVSDNPTSIPSRQVMLSEAEVLTQGFNTMSSKFEEIRTLNNNDMESMVDNINTLATSIADLNVQISSELARSSGLIKPNDLLDKQDALLAKLAEIVNVTVIPQSDGSSSVFIGSGQGLILQGGVSRFTTLPSPVDQTKLNIGIKTPNATMDITNQITGGTLAGALRFRDEVLDTAQQKLGRVAAGLAIEFNALHKKGFDLSGVAGTDFFSFAGTDIPVTQDSGNTGNALVTVNYQDANVRPSAAANLDFSDFTLAYVNAVGPVNYTLTRSRDNQVINLTATTVGGISTLSFAPVASQPANFKPAEFDMTTTITPGRFTPAISDGSVAIPREETFGAFTEPVASAGGQTFTMDIDGIAFYTNTSTALGDTVTKANLDIALSAFLTANPGYQQVSGSFADNNLRLRKLNGTDIVVNITANTFGAPAAFAPNIVSITGAPAVAATGGPFTLDVDGLTIYTEAASPGGSVTASELDTALNTFLTSGAGLGIYTKTGSFANNDLVLSKLDGTASTMTITNFSAAGSSPASFSGSLVGELASPGGVKITVDLTGGKTISVGDEFLTRPTYSAAQKIGVNIDDPRKIAAATNIEIDPVTKLPVSMHQGPMPSDNRNAAQLANLENKLGMLGGSASFSDAYGQIVSSVGTLTQSSGIIASAQETLLNQARAAREGVAGVNLDEEAASLMKFQQAYQASAQSIAVAKSLFDTLIGSVR